MTVKITKPALNLREELASLRNQGSAYEESKFYLDSLVTNGTFVSDSVWSKGTGWSISGGSASCDGTQTSDSYLSSNVISIESGKSYVVSFDLTHTSGAVDLKFAGTTKYTHQSTGTSTYTIVADSNSSDLDIVANQHFIGSVDNISVHETDGTDAIHSTPYGYEVKDVYIDGDLAREGEAYDYTVHDGYIKPTIEPTATTETCLIGVRK